jgi:hypothetical protein
MAKKRKTLNPTTTVMVEGIPVTIPIDEDPAFAELRSSLMQIKKIPGIKGYILKNQTMAVIDLQTPNTLTENALIMSETIEACQEISKLFHLAATKSVVEGSDVKMLCMIIGENKLGIFTEKSVDHTDIFRQISL